MALDRLISSAISGPLDRRTFLLGAGSLFLSSLNGSAKDRVFETDTLFASCIKKPDGSFGVVLLDKNFELIKDIELPQRGHDVVFDGGGKLAVIFSRRPGNFATILQTQGDAEPEYIIAPIGRHFYGHGVFSGDNKLLFASENDYDNAVGKIGIYDVIDKFMRIGEFESFGVGPHEIILLNDGKTLVVANGGIETHPEFGRAKLNLATMLSSIAFIDMRNGNLIERHLLPVKMRKLSIRHMVSNGEGGEKSVVFGGQYQGVGRSSQPLMGNCIMGEGLRFWEVQPNFLKQFANYTGSLAISRDKASVAISSPKGGVVGIFDASSGRVQKQFFTAKANGLVSNKKSFITTSQSGRILAVKTEKQLQRFNFSFDNHIAAF